MFVARKSTPQGLDMGSANCYSPQMHSNSNSSADAILRARDPFPVTAAREFFFWTHFRLRKFPNQSGQRSNSTRSHTPIGPLSCCS